MKKVLNNIRMNVLPGLIMAGLIGLGVTLYAFDIVCADDKSLLFIIIPFAVLFDWLAIKGLIIFVDPTKDPVFKKYGSPAKVASIIDNIEKHKIYENKNIILSDKYYFNKHDYSDLVAFDDILGVHKLVHKRNFYIDYYAVQIIDKYGFEHSITFRPKEENECNKLLEIFADRCLFAEIGYTDKEREHIKNNTEKLPDSYNENDDILCDSCGSIILDEDTICPKCENQVIDTKVEENNNIIEEKLTIDEKYEKLKILKDLLDKEILTKEEFDEEKKKILNS